MTDPLTPIERLRMVAFHLGPVEHDELHAIARDLDAGENIPAADYPSDDLVRFMQQVQLAAWPDVEEDEPLLTEERLLAKIERLASGASGGSGDSHDHT